MRASGTTAPPACRVPDRRPAIDPSEIAVQRQGDAEAIPGPAILCAVVEARREVLAAGVAIDAPPILRPDDPGRARGGLEAACAARITGGPGAFVVTDGARSAGANFG